jgi:hypothetical protein
MENKRVDIKRDWNIKLDWMPHTHYGLYQKACQTVNYLTAYEVRTRLGFTTDTPQGKWLDGEFYDKYTAFVTAYQDYAPPTMRTRMKTKTFVAAKKVFTPVYRKLYSVYLKDNMLATSSDLLVMGLPTREKPPAPPVPKTAPVSYVAHTGPKSVVIRFRNGGGRRLAKPRGAHGAEMIWAVLDAPPQGWDYLTNTSFSTRVPFRLTFEDGQRGKKLYFAMRWINLRGKPGPWESIQSTYIP